MEKKGLYKLKKIGSIIGNLIYYAILIPLIIITLMIIYQQIMDKDKIPDIFGWKLFIILDEYMDDSIKYGDLVFTKNIEPKELKTGEVIAFRNGTNTVTIHKILNFKDQEGIDPKTKEERTIRTFEMKALENETNDTRNVIDTKIEGILRHRIPFVRNSDIIYSRTISVICNSMRYSYNRLNFIICSTRIRQKR